MSLLGIAASACGDSNNTETWEPVPEVTAATLRGYYNAASVEAPPEGWTGPVYALNTTFPTHVPETCDVSECPWLGVDLDMSSTSPTPWEGAAEQYSRALLDYIKRGQDLSPNGWNILPVDGPRWYTTPYMAANASTGREFIHGMTSELASDLSVLLGPEAAKKYQEEHPGTVHAFETWATSYFNRFAGYHISQQWNAHTGHLNLTGGEGRTLIKGLPFREGSVLMKLLFTAASSEEVPTLRGFPSWTANRHKVALGCERAPLPVNLVQIDISAVDNRSPTKWVFATYAWDGNLPEGDSLWDRLLPLGLMWGSDPDSFPGVSQAESKPLIESVSNPAAMLDGGGSIYEHLGCNGRLAGPVDNSQSACLSCHMAGYVAGPTATMQGQPNEDSPDLCKSADTLNKDYFANRVYPDAYPGYEGGMPTGGSLQLQVAIQNYREILAHGAPAPCVASGGSGT